MLCYQREETLSPRPKIPTRWKPDPITPTWKVPIDRDCLIQEIQTGRCKAIGLLTGQISGGIVAVDHDGESCDSYLTKKLGLPTDQALSPSIKFSSGKQGHYQILYLIPQVFWKFTKTTKWLTEVGNEQIELRWNNLQSVFLGAHPQTEGYGFISGCSPKEITIQSAPMWIIRAMLTFSHLMQKPRKDWTDREWALDYLPWCVNHDLDWTTWRNILFALHHAEVEKEIALIWSMTSEKHTDKGFDEVWEHIKDDKSNPVTVASLGDLAKQNGWQGKARDSSTHISPSAHDEDAENVEQQLGELINLEQANKPQLLVDGIYEPLGELAHQMNLPVEVYICALLPILASLIHSKTRLIINKFTNHKAVAVVWIGLVGESGTKKKSDYQGLNGSIKSTTGSN
ncbi:MAG: hypothetical protein HC796_04685 [Synechococcaceae cyanobacterium RL_1_2]|nr:hypothetical protein [Synechococcaceae cyanobacterium RL_1_2]